MRFADSHLHLAEPDNNGFYPDIDDAELLLSCAAQYRDWNTQRSLSRQDVVCFYGIHPWYHEQWNLKAKDELVDILEKDGHAQVGEIGMDNKRPNLELQSTVFSSQVMIASEYGRCVNVHNQGCDGDIVRILKKHGKGCRSIILHSFKGPNIKPFSELDCYFSMNARMLGKSPEKIRDMLLSIPEDRLLVETDAPFLSNKFDTMDSFIGQLADIMGVDRTELAETTYNNARRSLE